MPEVSPGSVAVAFLDPGTWSACFGLSYRDLLLYDTFSSQRIVRPGAARAEMRAYTGAGQIPANRNKAARALLDESDAEWLWFIDSDMGFAPDTVDRLIKAADPTERPVVGGLCFAGLVRTKASAETLWAPRYLIQPTIYTWVREDDEQGVRPILDYPRAAIVPVAATGAACLLIHRGALAAVRERYGDAWFDPITHPTAFKGRPRTFSEDLSFCVRLAACDIPVHVDTGVKTTHDKGFLFLDEETFDAQQRALTAEQEIADG